MTLSTDIYILDKVNSAEVFRFCQTMIGFYDTKQRGPMEQLWHAKPANADQPLGAWRRDNTSDQGLPAWLTTNFNPSGPLRTTAQAAEHDGDCLDEKDNEPCDGTRHEPACWMSIDVDTSYGYEHPVYGWSAEVLHALFIRTLGAWLEPKSVAWRWRNEYTGECFDGYEGLVEFSGSIHKPERWYTTLVLPVLMMHISREHDRM